MADVAASPPTLTLPLKGGGDSVVNSARSSEETAAVLCDKITVRFTTERGTVTALQDVSIAVPSGSLLTLLGPSGCGKSTLLRVVADLIAPTSGTATVLGGKPSEARKRRD